MNTRKTCTVLACLTRTFNSKRSFIRFQCCCCN